MGYQQAIHRGWQTLKEQGKPDFRIKFLNNRFDINPIQKRITPADSGESLNDHQIILILHYLANENKIADITNDSWISFKQLSGGEIYFPTFRKRAIDPILNIYSSNPSGIFSKMEAFEVIQLQLGSAAIEIPVFEKIRVRIIIWEEDDEFPAECSILFNKSIKHILPTEDVAVLCGIIAYNL